MCGKNQLRLQALHLQLRQLRDILQRHADHRIDHGQPQRQPRLQTWYGITVAPCNLAVTKKGVTAIPCGVDKYNSYRKYGETFNISQVSKFGILRAGMWYEWANTNRHQYPSDPLNNWADQPLPNFAEKFCDQLLPALRRV